MDTFSDSLVNGLPSIPATKQVNKTLDAKALFILVFN